MLKLDNILLVLCIISGIVMLYFGKQYVFNTENFLKKVVERQKLDEDSIQSKYLKNKSNLIFHKMNGIGLLLCGIICIVLPILKLLKLIK